MLWLLIVVGIYAAAILFVAWFHLHPVRIPVFLSPGALGAPQEDVEIVAEDSRKLRGWWMQAENATSVAVFSHGYFMNRAEMVPIAAMLWKRGVSCLLFDFRAHGRSEGRKSSMGLHERHDVIAWAKWARERAGDLPVVLIGSSMGCAANAFALADEPTLADAMVMDSAYSRLSDAIIGWWRFLGGKHLAFFLAPTAVAAIPLAGFSPFKVDVAVALASMGPIPTLFLHGAADDLALPSQAERNEAACTGPRRLVWFPGCGHSEARWIMPFHYQRELLAFLWEHGFLAEAPEHLRAPLEAQGH